MFNPLREVSGSFKAAVLRKAHDLHESSEWNTASVELHEGWFSNEIVFESIIEIIKPRQVIEVGTFTGNSACYMHKLIERQSSEFEIYCVDTYLGSVEHWLSEQYFKKLNVKDGKPKLFEQFLERARQTGSINLVPVCLPSSTAADIFRKLGCRS